VSGKNESFGKTLGVVVAVCLVCSIVVSGAAVGLRQLQQKNATLDRQSNILKAAGLLQQANGNIADTFERFVEKRYVDLSTGEFVDAPSEDFDMIKAAKEEDSSVKVDMSGLGFSRRAKVASVYLVKDESSDIQRVVVPVYGSGLWGLMYGFLAVDNDGNTIRELIYYEHQETPGLGAEVLNPSWQAKWDGKKLYDDGDVAITVTKNAKSSSDYQVDALSGATLTSNGVQRTLRYWASENGYAPFFDKKSWRS
jgi:Na+-transporting NADH:ubiquinone oxidoreductase subunit C